MNRISSILMLVFLIPLILYLFFHGMAFMEPVNKVIEKAEETTLVLIASIAVFLVILPQVVQGMTKNLREIRDSVRSITENGIKGWATVERIHATGRKLGGNTLYFLDLNVVNDGLNNYELTILQPIRRKDLGYFIPGTKTPIITSSKDRAMVIFPQLDYWRLRGFYFMDEDDNEWKLAQESKKEISLTQVGVAE